MKTSLFALTLFAALTACGTSKQSDGEKPADGRSAPGEGGWYRGCHVEKAGYPAYCIEMQGRFVIDIEACNADGGTAVGACSRDAVVSECPSGEDAKVFYYKGWKPGC